MFQILIPLLKPIYLVCHHCFASEIVSFLRNANLCYACIRICALDSCLLIIGDRGQEFWSKSDLGKISWLNFTSFKELTTWHWCTEVKQIGWVLVAFAGQIHSWVPEVFWKLNNIFLNLSWGRWDVPCQPHPVYAFLSGVASLFY